MVSANTQTWFFPFFFRCIQRNIRGSDKTLGRIAKIREKGYPDADGYACIHGFADFVVIGYFHQQSVCDTFRHIYVCVWQYDGKLITAIACSQINIPYILFDSFRDQTDTFITALMPIVIVKQLKIIHIDHEKCKRLTMPVGPLELQLDKMRKISLIV